MKDIDLFELFYCGSGTDETITDDELRAFVTRDGGDGDIENLPCPCTKISHANMDKVLLENAGLTLEEMSGKNLNKFTYLEEYDAYYHLHGDTNYRGFISFYKGEQQGDLIHLYYEDGFYGDGDKVLTLKEQNGSYLFVSNQIANYTRSGSVAQPEGSIADHISVPNEVKTTAQAYVQKQYRYWIYSTGVYETVDNTIQMVGDPAVYDNWRIEGLSQVDTLPLNTGTSLMVYQLDYQLHTTTPEKVVLAGGMVLDDDSWLTPTYPHSTYLVFEAQDNQIPVYRFPIMINDAKPGDIRFRSDVLLAYKQGFPMTTEGARAEILTEEFFSSFTTSGYEAMKPFCTPEAVSTYFHEGDVFGMEWARWQEMHFIGEDDPEHERLSENEDAVLVTVEMKAAPTSALYDPAKEIQTTSFYVIFVYQDNGEYLIDRFVTGL